MRPIASTFFVALVFFAATLTKPIASAWSFDYSAYKPSTLEEIGGRTKETATKHKHEGGLDFYRERLRVKARLSEYPREISEGAKKVLEYYFKSFGLNLEHLKLFTYELKLEESGYSFLLVFQKQLIPYLKKESKPGDFVSLYVLLGIYAIENKMTILLVNEFAAEHEGNKNKKG